MRSPNRKMSWNFPWSPTGSPLRGRVTEFTTRKPKAVFPQRHRGNDWDDLELSPIATKFRSKRRLHNGNHAYVRRLGSLALLPFVTMMICWVWLQKDDEAIHFGEWTNLTPKLLNVKGLQFIEADHPYIRYVGRWTAVGMRRDGSFPGVYFDFVVNGSKTVLLSLHNSDITFSSMPADAANPTSILVKIDEDDYYILPNATSTLSISPGSLSLYSIHQVRVTAPMIGGEVETLQVEGVWIDEGGSLLPSPRSDLHEDAYETPLEPQPETRKMLEIVTDLPGLTARRSRGKSAGAFSGLLLGGVLGWEYLLGEMFRSDHVTVGMDGMCLISECIGGKGAPASLSDVFFRSGPVGSKEFPFPWHFEAYVPDVMVMNVGHADWESFQAHAEEYNRTLTDLSSEFEDTYIAMIKAIRTLAYTTSTGATPIPIFVMRPFRGQLEQAARSVVDRLRWAGDQFVFWLDTSGWLNTNVDFAGRPEEQDFFLDGILRLPAGIS